MNRTPWAIGATLVTIFCGGLHLGDLLAQQAPAAQTGRAGGAGGRGRGSDPSLPLVQKAFTLTDPRFLVSFGRYCMLNGPNTANGKGAAAPPSKLFDNFFYVGRTDVGAWVLRTSDGLVLFDTLNSIDEATNIVVPGMRKLGLDPNQIKLVVLTHFHNDHTGGMAYFRDKGIRIMASEVDWGQLGGAPNADSVVRDGQVVRLGDTSLTMLLIPGHTPGTLGTIFPVFENGQRHMAILTGGIGPGAGVQAHQTGIASLQHAASAAKQAGVDVFVDPHEAIIDSAAWGFIMRPDDRQRGRNDLIIGGERFQRFMQMLDTCLRARVVMYEQQPLPSGQ